METALTVRCTLKPTSSQAEALGRTVDAFAMGCNHALQVARRENVWNKFRLQRLVYADLRAMGLSANLAVRAIARVGKRKGRRTGGFKATSVDYDQRILSLNRHREVISLATVAGRLKIPLAIGNYQRHLLRNAISVQGGTLVRGQLGKWYIHLLLRVDVPTPPGSGRVVGVDLGQKVMAASSEGALVSAGALKGKRIHYRRKRAELQAKGTKGARRTLKRLSGTETRFVRQMLHTIARRLVESRNPGDTIAVEDLTHLRGRTRTCGKEARHLHHLWPYGLFRFLLEYKAALKGVQVVAVDPQHTSQECPRCGHTSGDNRRSQALFRCQACRFQHNADWVAATNIARRAGSMGAGPQGSTPAVCNRPLIRRELSRLHLPL